MAFTDLTVKEIYQGDGVTTTFAIPFTVIDDAETEVLVFIKDETQDPVDQDQQALATHYNIVGDNVVFVTAPSATDKVVIARELPLIQDLDLMDNADFVPETQELHLDKIVAMIQQLDEKIARAPLAHISEEITDQFEYGEPVASTVIGWNSDATQVQLYEFSDITAISDAALQAHLDDTVDAHNASAISSVASGNLIATNVQTALDELQTNIDLFFGTSALGGSFALITNGSGKITTSSVTSTELGYLSGVTSGIQAQIATVSSNISNHISDSSDAHDASAISVVPTGNLASSNVQAALEEIQTEIDNLPGGGGGPTPATTDELPEGVVNFYYTEGRFTSSFGGKSTSNLVEGSNLYFTDERVDDRVNALLVAGTGITKTYNDALNTLTLDASLTVSRMIFSISTPQTLGSAAGVDYVYFVSGTTTVTMPTAVSNTNRYTVKNTGVATVTIDFTGGQTGDGSSSLSLPVANTSLDLISDNTNWRIV